jgi:hypothetical protein
MGCGTSKSSVEKVKDLCWDDGEGSGTSCRSSRSLCGIGHPEGSCACSCFVPAACPNSTRGGSSLGCYCPGAPRGHDAYSTASAVLHAVGGKLEHAAEGAVHATHGATTALRHAASSADEAGKRALGLTSTPEEQEVFNAHNIVLVYDPSHTHNACFTRTHACTKHVSHIHLNKSYAHVHSQPKSYTLSQRHMHTDPQTIGARTRIHTQHTHTQYTQAQLKDMNFHGSAIGPGNAIRDKFDQAEHHQLSSHAYHEHHE